jgi:MFS family permease
MTGPGDFSTLPCAWLACQSGSRIAQRHFMRQIPAAVWLLTLAFALMMSGTSMMVLIAGIIVTGFAPNEKLATLPIALVVVGAACAMLPTGKLLDRFGRRPVFIGYGVLAICGGLLAMASVIYNTFIGFCGSGLVLGWSAAAGSQYRFAALEAVPPPLAHKATSVLLMGGILGAFVGPELAVRGRDVLPVEYAGSFLLLVGAYVLGLALILGYRDRHHQEKPGPGQGRPLREILAARRIRLAIAAGALSYAVMSFIMTATPISMHNHAGHSLEATKFVLQAHIAAMYLPSLLFAWLFSRMGFMGLFWLGTATYVACLGVALAGTELLHYWVSLALLGVGWNFLFLAGTNLLPHTYQPDERFRVQSMNDFLVVSVQAAVSLASGWFLALLGWQGLLLSCVPLLLVFMVMLWRWRGELVIPQQAATQPPAG